MKTINKGYLFLLMLALLVLPVQTHADDDSAGVQEGLTVIEGTSSAVDAPVTLMVCKPGYTAADVTASAALTDCVLYADQTVTDNDGSFSFSFLLESYGSYRAYVAVEGEDTVREYTVGEEEVVPVAILDADFNGTELLPYLNGSMATGFTGYTSSSFAQVVRDSERALQYTGVSRLYKDFHTTCNAGVYLLEFDTRADGADAYQLYLRLYNQDCASSADNDNLYNAFGIRENGLGYYQGDWNFISGTARTDGQWYNVKLWLDFEARVFSYYVDNTLLGSVEMPREFYGIRGFSMIGAADTYLDNVRFVQVDPAYGKQLYRSYGDMVPQAARQDYYIKVSSGQLGNIFSGGQTVALAVAVTQYAANAKDLQVQVTIAATAGPGTPAVYEESISALEYGVPYHCTISPDALPYGLYEADIAIVENGQRVHTQTAEFSVVNLPPRGQQNAVTGVAVHPQNLRGNMESVMEMVEDAGYGLVRGDFAWSSYEKTPGVYTLPARMKEFIQCCEEQGLDYMLTVHFYNPIYADDQGHPNGLIDVNVTDGYLEHFKAFLTYLAKNDAKSCKYFEIINEPNYFDHVDNIIDHNNAEQMAQYVKVLRYGYEGVKAGNPQAKVLGPAITTYYPAQWMQAFLDAGGDAYVDIYTYHPYDLGKTPEEGYVKRLEAYMNVVNPEGSGSKPVWASEMGFATSANYPAVTPVVQANYSVRQAVLNHAMGLPLERTVYYDLQEDGIDPADDNHHYGAVKPWYPSAQVPTPYAAKPLYGAMTNYHSLMHDAVYTAAHTISDTATAYAFRSGDREIRLAWTQSGSQTYTLDNLPPRVYTYDLYGNQTAHAATEGSLTLTLTEEPVYIEIPAVEITAVCNGREIESLEGLAETDVITLSVTRRDSSPCTVYVAGYARQEQQLVGVTSGSMTTGTQLTYTVGKADMMQVLIWDGNCHPLTAQTWQINKEG